MNQPMFTVQELAAIVRICDAAVRQGGLDIAQIALPIAGKAQQLSQMMTRENTRPQLIHENSREEA
jgi:hypothetical protein